MTTDKLKSLSREELVEKGFWKCERILAAIGPIAASQTKLSVFQTIKGWFA